MSCSTLPLSQERIALFDLETVVNEAATLNQRTLADFTTPFPKGPERWLSHDHFKPRPIEFTAGGEVEGGLSWRLGSTVDLRFTRALLAPYYAEAGGHCDDPASFLFLEVAAEWIATPTLPASVPICAGRRRAAGIARVPVYTRPFRAKTI